MLMGWGEKSNHRKSALDGLRVDVSLAVSPWQARAEVPPTSPLFSGQMLRASGFCIKAPPNTTATPPNGTSYTARTISVGSLMRNRLRYRLRSQKGSHQGQKRSQIRAREP